MGRSRRKTYHVSSYCDEVDDGRVGAAVTSPDRPSADIPRAALAFAALLVLTVVVFGPMLSMSITAENVQWLYWADQTPTSSLLRPDSFWEWRPLPSITVWLQYRLLHLNHLAVHFYVNLLLWTICAWFVYQIVERLTHAFAPALAAAAVVATDMRVVEPILTFGRTTVMACLFGLAGYLLIVNAREARLTRSRWVATSLLLIAAPLCKEFGIAFAGAASVWGLVERRRDVASSGMAAVTLYAVLRVAIVGGAMQPYCEETGYFFDLRTVCFGSAGGAGVAQVAYTVAAGVAGGLVPALFGMVGKISLAVDPRWFAASAVWLAFAAVGWWKGPTSVRLTILVVTLNAVAGFMMYRPRNHAVAFCASGIAVGVGLAVVNAATRRTPWPRTARAALAMAVAATLASQALGTRAEVVDQVADEGTSDPCQALIEGIRADRAFVTKIKSAYHMTNPDCKPVVIPGN